MTLQIEVEGAEPRSVRLTRSGSAATVWIDGRRHGCSLRAMGDRVEVTVDDTTELAWIVPDGDAVHIHAFGRAWRVAVTDPAERSARAEEGDDVATAPMPGTVVSVSVEPGDAVAAGQRLLVIESMKMQNEIIAWRAGRVERILVEVGETFDRGAGLVALVPEQDGEG